MSTNLEIDEKDFSKMVAGAVMLQLSPETREAILANAIKSYLEQKSDRYDKTSRSILHKTMLNAVDEAVKNIALEMLKSEPYQSRLRAAIEKEAELILAETQKTLRVKVGNVLRHILADINTQNTLDAKNGMRAVPKVEETEIDDEEEE